MKIICQIKISCGMGMYNNDRRRPDVVVRIIVGVDPIRFVKYTGIGLGR